MNKTGYARRAVPFTDVTFDDDFWTPRLETNRTVTIPYDFQKCEETGRIANFVKAAGDMDGDHEGRFYNDSDVFKIVEGAAYSLASHPDPELDAYIDELVDKIGRAQEPDGYLYTPRTIAERTGRRDRLDPEREGTERWSNLRVNHELYNVGHLYEAAVAHYRATGKRGLLDIALKNADLIDQVFGPDERRDVPGHQEIEIGLVKLYLVTGEERFLRLARFFLDERGHPHHRPLYSLYGNPGYMQDHLPVTQQAQAVGHAVRAGYMYTAMADVAAMTDDDAYVAAIDRIWEDVVFRKLYLTGGIGARHQGEAFGDAYELPNETAYAETCAAIANVLWNLRMFLLHGEGRFIDVLERTLYNGLLAGISLGGNEFFYVNPLAWDGLTSFNRSTQGRQPWFETSCCPSNVVRFLPSLPGYVYAVADDECYVNLYVASQATVGLAGVDVHLRQQTDYPWSGSIRVDVEPAVSAEFSLNFRIPGWSTGNPVPSDLYRYAPDAAVSPQLTVNGVPYPVAATNGYVRIQRTWSYGDVVDLELPMPVRRDVAHPSLQDNANRIARERGPLVYCVEAVDNPGDPADWRLPESARLHPVHRPELLGGVTVIQAEVGDRNLMYIPYYAWAHRELGSNGRLAAEGITRRIG